MGRPRIYEHPRVTTAVRLAPEIRDRLRVHARQRDVSVNHLVNRAIEDLLAQLDAAGPVVVGSERPGVSK